MKKLGLLLMPLMAISFLASCNNGGGGGGGGGDDPEPEPTEEALDKYSWEEINEISQSGKASETFKIGDAKTVKVNNIDHKVRIIGFNHDYSELPDDGSEPESSKVLGITFEFADVITDSNGAVTTAAASFDYRKSDLNKFLNSDENCIYNRLPEDLRKVIKQVDKKVGVSLDNGATFILASFDGDEHPYPYLFSLSGYEIYKDNPYFSGQIVEGEGDPYQYYKDSRSASLRSKKKVDGADGEQYWLRSTNRLSNPAYILEYGIDLGGFANQGWTTVTGETSYFAVAPAFCI